MEIILLFIVNFMMCIVRMYLYLCTNSCRDSMKPELLLISFYIAEVLTGTIRDHF